MQNVTIKSLSFFMGAALLALLCLAACDDKPTEPPPVNNYSVYFIDAMYDEGNWYFAYHPTTNQLDSFWLPYTSAPVISADGKKMYVSNRGDSLIAVVDLKSLAVIDQLPYKQAIAVSPDNQLIAVLGEGVHILRTSDYSEVFHDSVTIRRGTFSRNSQRFYGITLEDEEVHVLDMSQVPCSSVIKSFDPFYVYDVTPSIDETKWFLYLFGGLDYFSFQVYDPIADSTIFRQDMTPGYGELELTPDGKLVFYTNAGNDISMPGPPWITVYDVAKNDIQTVTTAGLLDPPYQAGIPLSEVAITPDNCWLVAVKSGTLSGYPFVLTLDINTLQFAKHRKLGETRNYHGVECQLLP